MIVVVLGSLLGKEGKTEVAFGGLIGPFIFGSATDPQVLKLILIVSAIVAVGFIIWILYGLR